jgi:hypothetical protein
MLLNANSQLKEMSITEPFNVASRHHKKFSSVVVATIAPASYTSMPAIHDPSKVISTVLVISFHTALTPSQIKFIFEVL